LNKATDVRLWWAGLEGSGILCVAGTADQAVASAHAEVCDCGEPEECTACGDWIALDIERELPEGYAIRLVRRGDEQSPTPVREGAPRLWWLFDAEEGEFAVGVDADAARESCMNADYDYEHVQEVRRVDGYDVVVVREQREEAAG